MGAKIRNISFYLPTKVLTNQDLSVEFKDLEIDKIENKIGIKTRHVVSSNETASDLAFRAAESVLENYDRSKIDFILFCTQSPDYLLPTTACILQKKLNLRTDIGALDFNLGCSGFVYGLSLSKSFILSGLAKNVLLLVGETYSKHIHPKDKANRAIFGDGAAATIICNDIDEKIGNFVLGTDGTGFEKLIIRNGGCRNVSKDKAETYEYGSGNFSSDDHIYMNGPDIFNFTIDKIPGIVDATLKKNSISLEEIDYFVFHQANRFMLDYLRKKIKIPKNKFYNDISYTGNTVSATIPIALSQAIDKGDIKTGDKVLLAGFGVGLSWAATVITI